MPILKAAERRTGLTVLPTLALFDGSCLVATRLGGEFLPKLSEGSIVVTSEKLPGINLDATLNVVKRGETVLKSFPEARGEEGGLTDGKCRNSDRPHGMRMDDALQGVRGDVAISLYGDDLNVLKDKADSIARVVGGVTGAADVKAEQQAGQPALSVQIDHAAAARYGVNVSDILDVVESIGGRTAGMVYGDDNSITDIVARLAAEDRSEIDRIRNLPVGSNGKAPVPLSLVASVEVTSVPTQISRDRLQRRISVQANVRGRDVQSFVDAAQAAVKQQVKSPPRYSLTWSGQYQHLQQATARLSVVVPAAMVAILVLLIVMFADIRLAGLIFLNVPIAATGGIIALFLRARSRRRSVSSLLSASRS